MPSSTVVRKHDVHHPIPYLPLPTGALIPQLGFGTYKVTEGVYEAVSSALRIGYRHIDTAQMYGNEAEVGRAIADSGIPREELFITSKLNNDVHEPGPAREAFAKTLRDLRTDYVDLFLIHWPLPGLYGGDLLMPWRVLEEFYAAGQARAIGLSNFEQHHVEAILEGGTVAPHVNQFEAHPYLPNDELRTFCWRQGIVTEAWSPLARGKATQDARLAAIGEAHGVSAAQVALRWALQRGDIIFPKSVTSARQEENFDLFGFCLSDEQMAAIAALDEGEAGRVGSHPDVMNRLR
ncbi:aldo/keto reductase [Schaalia sp. Marseille-Q2122]|uniref:aldo/keto reductase n=1 Tax=Schaalia sp. Marseille-Q2122 TaxID=2736604 RepID=UPI00158E18DF|nr:aldo/keto reductase [Schaalia sp. Marseille-Q2122]